MSTAGASAAPPAVVTGASSGICRATAIELAKAGYRVFAGARRVEKIADLARHGITVQELDLTEDASMRPSPSGTTPASTPSRSAGAAVTARRILPDRAMDVVLGGPGR